MKKPIAKIGTEEENNWTIKKEQSERHIKEMKEDLKNIPFLIKFHTEIIKMCEKQIALIKHSGRNK